MKTTTYKVIGLMSGTSLDGLDIAYCHITKNNNSWNYQIVKTKSVDYTPQFQARLKTAIQLSATDLLVFHNEYGTWLGKQAAQFIAENNLEVDFIASHGHTVHHQPENGFTFQIGSGQHLANASGKKVICDFRSNDVALGGQGAPLVPIGDRLLFGNYDFCLNLGGIGNISFEKEGERIAYDIAPINMLLNHLAQKLNKPYDKNGQLAQKGVPNNDFLEQLNALAYYHQSPPKSLGYEWFENNILPIAENISDAMENLLHTAVQHIAIQIAKSIKNVPTTGKIKTVLVTGGGAKNDFLIHVLQQQLGSTYKVVVPKKDSIDYKEALIFALIGVLRERNEVNCLHSVTGAAKDSSSGVIYIPC
ncbi:anhydro-N-acetylmuramic acid kinase [Leptobacterium sp. I13]|uniref:anhydro-N-acetylmuramic acid kinase n=1 Tax=Leptobacterium meishanense TaxID=3128904 RepID=UPI0030EC554F